jgi:hypothetical protein
MAPLYTPACTFQSCTLLEVFPHLFLSFIHQHIYLTAHGENKINQNKKNNPTGKRRNGTSQGCIIPVEKTINTRLLTVALLFLVVYS